MVYAHPVAELAWTETATTRSLGCWLAGGELGMIALLGRKRVKTYDDGSYVVVPIRRENKGRLAARERRIRYQMCRCRMIVFFGVFYVLCRLCVTRVRRHLISDLIAA